MVNIHLIRPNRLSHGNEVVVITGAGAGLGRAIAQRFAANGASIGLVGRDRDRLQQAANEVRQLGGQAVIAVADVAVADQVEAAAALIEAAYGRIDIWINNAMATVYSTFEQISADDFKRATEVTYLGTVYGTMAALKRMKPRNYGLIVQVGSALAYRAIPLQSPYCGAKFAVRGFTDALRSELLHDRSKIRLTMVHMPAMNTPQFDWGKNLMPMKAQPVPPIFQPETAANAIFWASRHQRREVYVCFPTWKTIWANKLIPGFIDRYLSKVGYEGQLSDEPAERAQQDNLWQPVAGNFAAHGRFGKRSMRGTAQLWITLYREPVVLAVLAAGIWACCRWLKKPSAGHICIAGQNPSLPGKLCCKEPPQNNR